MLILNLVIYMLSKMTLKQGLFIIAMLQPVLSYEGDCIKIGIISKGSDEVITTKVSNYGLNVSLVRYQIDTSEIYHIFKTIKKLDSDVDVDVIILFDYDASILRMPELLKTKNKRLIKWGERQTKNRQKNNEEQRKLLIDPSDIYGTEDFLGLGTEDPHCIQDLNTTFEQREDNMLTGLGPNVLTALVKHLQWRSIFLFYETYTEVETSDLVDALSKEGVLLSMFNIDDEESLLSLLQRIYQAEIHHHEINIVVFCQMPCAQKLLRTANNLQSINPTHKAAMEMFSKYLVVVNGHSNGVSHALQACANKLNNLAIIALPGINRNGTKALNKILQAVLLDNLAEELNGSPHKFKKAIIDILEKKATSGIPTSHCLAYIIDTLLHTKSGRRFQSVGYIEQEGNLVTASDIFPNTKYGYNKRHFTVSTLVYPPWVIKKEINGTIDYEGVCMDLLKELSNRLNFTFTVKENADGKWGSYVDYNRTFNGLVGQLQRQEVDMVAAPLSASPERSEVMDFCYPFFYEYLSVIVKKPDINATKWRTLVDPFKWEVLVFIAFALIVMTLMAVLLEKYNPYYETPQHSTERQSNGGLHTWHGSFWYMYGVLFCQGGVHLPESIAGRTLVSSWLLFCIVIVGIYCGNLIAFLTVTKEKPPFDTLAEMIKLKGSYRWGILADTHSAAVFLKSKNPTYKAIGDGIRDFNKTDPNVLNADPDAHIRKVKKEKYAWIGEKTRMEMAMAKECSLMLIKEEFLPSKNGFGFVKNSPHTAIFTKQIIKLHEAGLFRIWMKKWWPKANFCTGSTVTSTKAKPISLMDVQSAFYVCFIGVFLGSAAFMIELIVQRCRRERSK